MREICEIVVNQMPVGEQEYLVGVVPVVWDRRSFWLSDDVDFHIILSELDDEGEEVRTDVTDDCTINVLQVQGRTIGCGDNIVFENVRITYSRRTHVHFLGEHEVVMEC